MGMSSDISKFWH